MQSRNGDSGSIQDFHFVGVQKRAAQDNTIRENELLEFKVRHARANNCEHLQALLHLLRLHFHLLLSRDSRLFRNKAA